MIRCRKCNKEYRSFNTAHLENYSNIVFDKYKGNIVAIWPRVENYGYEFTMECKKCKSNMGSFILRQTVDMQSIDPSEFYVPSDCILLSLYKKIDKGDTL